MNSKAKFKLSFLKNCDLFGQPVSFNRKGDVKFTSVCGGISSLILVIGVFVISKVKIHQ